MDLARIVVLTTALLLVGILYNKYKSDGETEDALADYKLVEDYLLNDSSLATSSKPLMWLHLSYEPNGRWWPSFFSRVTREVNQPYLNLTIKSLVEKCGDSFNICIIDDRSFAKIIPGWDVDLERVGSPVKEHLRAVALMKVLHAYGGLIVPPSFLCMEDLGQVYSEGTEDDALLCGEVPNRSVSASSQPATLSTNFIGCRRGSTVCGEFIEELARMASQDSSDAVSFLGKSGNWLEKAERLGHVNKVDGTALGVISAKGTRIDISELLGQSQVDFAPNLLGILFPAEEALERTNYQWFPRLSPKQVLASNTCFGRALLRRFEE